MIKAGRPLDLKQIADDNDFDPIRNDPAFRKFLDEYKGARELDGFISKYIFYHHPLRERSAAIQSHTAWPMFVTLELPRFARNDTRGAGTLQSGGKMF